MNIQVRSQRKRLRTGTHFKGMFHSLNIANFVFKKVQEHIHDSVELTIISQVGRNQGAQYPVAQPRKCLGTQTVTVNEGFSSITLQSVLVLKGTKKTHY